MKGSSFGYLIKEGAKSIYANRLMSFASIGTLVACMLLIGASMLFSMNVNKIVGFAETQNEVVVQLEDGLDEEQIADVGLELGLVDNIYNQRFVSKDELLEEQKAKSPELEDLLTGLEGDQNPLFNYYSVRVKDLSVLTGTVMRLESISGGSAVRAPDAVAEAFSSIKRAVSVSGMFIVAILIVVSLVIIANTIKVTVFNRRKEINIMKYVGATDAFIRLPFFVEGFLLGLLSALLAFGLLWVGYNYVLDAVSLNPSAFIQSAYQNTIPFEEVALELLAWFAGGGIGIGVFGSMFFVNRYLKV